LKLNEEILIFRKNKQKYLSLDEKKAINSLDIIAFFYFL